MKGKYFQLMEVIAFRRKKLSFPSLECKNELTEGRHLCDFYEPF